MRPHVTAVVGVAQSQKEQLVRDGYRPEAIRVIVSGVADDPPVRNREALRTELDIAPESFLAVLVTTLRPEKRASVFVDQVAAAHAAEPVVRGLVVGDGPDTASVVQAVERSGGVVRMLGFRADAVDIMHAADVVCLTSAVEALPMSVLEAMSVARPVIATHVGGLSEVVVDGETGLLISPDQPWEMAAELVGLARDASRLAQLGQAGRERQQRLFSIEAMTSGYAELLADLDRPAAQAHRHEGETTKRGSRPTS
jgi:glycosyltransferase involved in cell wall biosynthesis